MYTHTHIHTHTHTHTHTVGYLLSALSYRTEVVGLPGAARLRLGPFCAADARVCSGGTAGASRPGSALRTDARSATGHSSSLPLAKVLYLYIEYIYR